MNADLKRRVMNLEAGHSGLMISGFIELDEAGNLSGVATFYDEPDHDLTVWLKTFTPKLENLSVLLICSYPKPDQTHLNTVPAAELHPEVKRLLTPYLTPGLSLHILDGVEGWPL